MDFVKHKFDMLLLVVLIVSFLFVLNHAAYYHNEPLMTWAETSLAGLLGAFINMLQNRTSERSNDTKKKRIK